MTLYVRKSSCACCGQQVIYDSDKREMACGCGTFKVVEGPLDININWIKLAEPLVAQK